MEIYRLISCIYGRAVSIHMGTGGMKTQQLPSTV